MKSSVVYYSRGGKTRRVAEVIAQQLGCETVDVEKETPDVSGVELLVVGSGQYPGRLHKALQSFLDGLQPSKGKAAVFATAGGSDPKVVYVLKGALEAKGYTVVSSFKCRGRFLFFNWSHPNEEDLENAKAFADDLKKGVHDSHILNANASAPRHMSLWSVEQSVDKLTTSIFCGILFIAEAHFAGFFF